MKNYFKRILITGGKGQAASALLNHPAGEKFELFPFSRDELDITDKVSINEAVQSVSPDIIINTAAYTAVDKAESEAEAARKVNHLGAEQLAIVCSQHQIPLIHLSTDYVFDGKASQPYTENDSTHPVNIYGKTKLAGEDAVKRHLDAYFIIRVSAIYSEYGSNFLKTMLQLARDRDELNIVSDQFTCPTDANDIAGVIFFILDQQPDWGTYHFCGNQVLSWYDFAEKIIDAAGIQNKLAIKQLKKIHTADYQSPAPRPLYTVLNNHKIESAVTVQRTDISDSIHRILKTLSKEI